MKYFDARAGEAPFRDTEIVRTFDALPAGDALVVIHDRYPKPLLLRLIDSRAGQFEWSVLEAGPELFRVQIVKRAADGERGVAEYMRSDHARLERILDRIVERLGRDDPVAAEVRFREFSHGLERHMRAEEEILFPVFERATGMTGGPLTIMRQEHHALLRQLDAVAAAFETGDPRSLQDEVREIRAILEQHNSNEESVVYPQTDERLGKPTLDQVVQLLVQTV